MFQKCDYWLRDKNAIIEAFPDLFPDGKFGLDYEREKKLTKAKFFAQRIMNEDPMYAMNADFLFVGQQMVETHALESKINISMSHGSLKKTGHRAKLTPSKDAYNIFQCLPGTPAYWKTFRSEIFSRMEQLGPFHLFFTLSCAEMRYVDKECTFKFLQIQEVLS